IELDPGRSIAGRVLDRNGRPVEGARVHGCSGDSQHDAHSDAGGRFELRTLEDSENAFVLVVADGYSLLARQPIRVGDGPTPLVARAGRGGGVGAGEGRPLAGARVHVGGDRRLVYDARDLGEPTPGEWAGGGKGVWPDAGGPFAFDPLSGGGLELSVSPGDEP